MRNAVDHLRGLDPRTSVTAWTESENKNYKKNTKGARLSTKRTGHGSRVSCRFYSCREEPKEQDGVFAEMDKLHTAIRFVVI